MVRKIIATLCAALFPFVGQAAFPYYTQTGTYATATSVGNWDAFDWKWSENDDVQVSVNFSDIVVSNCQFRMSYPKQGNAYLTVTGGTITTDATSTTWTFLIPQTNLPPNNTYYSEFMAYGTMSTSGVLSETRTLAKGKVTLDISLFARTNTASWTPVIIAYNTSLSTNASIVETDPIYRSTSNLYPRLSVSNVFTGNGSISEIDFIGFDTNYSDGVRVGRLQWNNTDGCPEIGLKGGTVNLQIGQEQLVYVSNMSGMAITNGECLAIVSASGNRVGVSKANASLSGVTNYCDGIATENIGAGSNGFMTTHGLVRDVNTAGFAEGAKLYLSATKLGGITNVAPSAPYEPCEVGIVAASHATAGIILASPRNYKSWTTLDARYGVSNSADITSVSNFTISATNTLNGLIVAGNLANSNHVIAATGAVTTAYIAADLAGSNYTAAATNDLRAMIIAGDLADTNHVIAATGAVYLSSQQYTTNRIAVATNLCFQKSGGTITGASIVSNTLEVTGAGSFRNNLVATNGNVYLGPAGEGTDSTGRVVISDNIYFYDNIVLQKLGGTAISGFKGDAIIQETTTNNIQIGSSGYSSMVWSAQSMYVMMTGNVGMVIATNYLPDQTRSVPRYALDVRGHGGFEGPVYLGTSGTASNQAISFAGMTNWAAGNVVSTGRTITAGTGLAGGGALNSNITIAVDLNYLDTLYQPIGSAEYSELKIYDTDYLGSELISNGTFTGAAAPAIPAYWAVSNATLGSAPAFTNAITVSAGQSGTISYTGALTMVTGALYYVQAKMVSYETVTNQVVLGGITSSVVQLGTSTNYLALPIALSTTGFTFILNAGPTYNVYLDDVSLKRITEGDGYVADDFYVGGTLYANTTVAGIDGGLVTNAILHGDGKGITNLNFASRSSFIASIPTNGVVYTNTAAITNTFPTSFIVHEDVDGFNTNTYGFTFGIGTCEVGASIKCRSNSASAKFYRMFLYKNNTLWVELWDYTTAEINEKPLFNPVYYFYNDNATNVFTFRVATEDQQTFSGEQNARVWGRFIAE